MNLSKNISIAPFGICFESYGARVGFRTNSPVIANALANYLPPFAKPIKSIGAENLFTILADAESAEGGDRYRYHLYLGERPVLATKGRPAMLGEVEKRIHAAVALESSPWLFVHAGVVGWENGAIVIPGRSMSGKTSLVAALVKAGATYYSDEYAVFDQDGYVHAYPRPLQPRIGHQIKKCTVEELGGHVGESALPVALVVATRYEPQAQWKSEVLAPAQLVLCLFENTIAALRRPRCAISIFARVAARCLAISGPRPSAESVVPSILALCEQANGL